MEEVLDVYERPVDLKRPVVCLDERPCFLIGDTQEVIPAKPGQLVRFDYQYVRNGNATVFGLFAPHLGWREMRVTERRTRTEFAECLKYLVDEAFPDAEKIVLVMDNLNTHSKASLYHTFPASEAHRIAAKLEWHFTPKHGSWLNAVEIEFAALTKQCLDRRIPDQETLKREVRAWTVERNTRAVKVRWQFTTPQARIKLAAFYPAI